MKGESTEGLRDKDVGGGSQGKVTCSRKIELGR